MLGCLPRDPRFALPTRHLGLVQAAEHAELENFLDAAADLVAERIDLDALRSIARPARLDGELPASPSLQPLGQRIAVARDDAFAFAYPAVDRKSTRLNSSH